MIKIKLGKMGNNIFATLGSQIFAGLFQLGIVVLIARIYGPEVNGRYAIALLLPGLLATTLNLGIAPANVYYLGAGFYSARAVFLTNIRFALILSVSGMCLGATLISYKGEEFFPGISQFMLFLALLVFPFSLAQGFILSIFQGLQRFKEYNIALISYPILVFISVIVLIIAGIEDFSYLIIANIFGIFVSLILSLTMLRKHLNKSDSDKLYPIKTALNYGYKAHLSNILAFLNYKADIFLVNLFITPTAAGVYVISVQISERLWLLSQAVSTVALPHLSQLRGNEEARTTLTPLLARLTLTVTFVAASMLAIIAYPLVLFLFGDEFKHSIIPLLTLLPGIVAGSASRILSNDIAARGRPELNMYMSIFTVSINIIGNIILIPLHGLFGAALATSLAYSLNFAIRLFFYWRLTNVTPNKVLFIRFEDILMLYKLFFTKK